MACKKGHVAVARVLLRDHEAARPVLKVRWEPWLELGEAAAGVLAWECVHVYGVGLHVLEDEASTKVVWVGACAGGCSCAAVWVFEFTEAARLGRKAAWKWGASTWLHGGSHLAGRNRKHACAVWG